MAVKMKIKVRDDEILLDNETGEKPFIILKKPEINDYSNVTPRTLVVNYHLVEDTIWERSCSLAEGLQQTYGKSPYLACYGLLFAELYPILLSSAQAKNVICYGMDEEGGAADLFQAFMTFLQEDSAFISLPVKSFAFSVLLNKSCQAAVVSLDACRELKIICDALSKIRVGGKAFLYTVKDDGQDALSGLLSYAEKKTFGSCVLYSITVDTDVSAYAFESNSEAAILPSITAVLGKFEELGNLTPAMKNPGGAPLEIYPYAVGLVDEIEKTFLALYDVLENPQLPILANALKEALMDCYIGLSNRFDVQTYFDRMWREMEAFCAAMEAEFG